MDVNHATTAALTKLPGVTDEVAGRIADIREQVGGFSSVNDLGLVLDGGRSGPRKTPSWPRRSETDRSPRWHSSTISALNSAVNERRRRGFFSMIGHPSGMNP